jgi:hypothetical protein
MRSFIAAAAAAAFAALAQAQDLDWDVVLQATPIADVTVPVVYATLPSTTASATTVAYTGEVAAAAVSSALVANPTDGFPLNSALAKRAASPTTCQAQPTGAGAVPSDDSATGFLSYSPFSTSAAAAPTPSGYVNTFTNLQASNNAFGYMGYTILQSYDTQSCADKCTKIDGCQAFNVYFERDPLSNPDSADCDNPKSTTQIKCVFWSGPVTSDNANNAGQMRRNFQVVISGSNGYVNQSIATPVGYNAGVFLDKYAINAPLSCTGDDTYLETHVFTGQPFDAGLCAAACNSQADYARATVKNGFVKACSFYNTYILYKNKKSVGQNCVLYDQTWASSYAKNSGYTNGNDHYTVGFSYSFGNKTDAGQPRFPCAVASASSAIVSASLQTYCSWLLSYSAAVSTSTVVVTPTVTSYTTLATEYPGRKGRRAAVASTPAALSKFAASVISSACALAVTSASASGSVTVVTSTAPATTSYVTSTFYQY